MIEEEIQEEENTFENEIDFYLNNLNSITLNTKEEDIERTGMLLTKK